MIGTNLDISERRRAQEEIEALNRTLRGNLEHLAVANRDLEDFASTASHDLQAPLRRIDSFARLLEAHRAPQLDPEERHWLARVRANTARMSELIDDLLTFARSTHTDIQRADTDLNALLRDIVDDVRDSTGARTVQWHIDNLPAAFCDPAMLRVVLANLISNALKFTRMQHVAVIEVGTLAAGDQEHIIFVRDNGVGFDIKLGKDMFSAFTRLHPDTEFEGTGIGLATVKRIIERHGGRVWAESKAGEGATFFVALPRRN
jgi:light-regulated signal transduction histidine kinase (bacteriophytochrome)